MEITTWNLQHVRLPTPLLQPRPGTQTEEGDAITEALGWGLLSWPPLPLILSSYLTRQQETNIKVQEKIKSVHRTGLWGWLPQQGMDFSNSPEQPYKTCLCEEEVAFKLASGNLCLKSMALGCFFLFCFLTDKQPLNIQTKEDLRISCSLSPPAWYILIPSGWFHIKLEKKQNLASWEGWLLGVQRGLTWDRTSHVTSWNQCKNELRQTHRCLQGSFPA